MNGFLLRGPARLVRSVLSATLLGVALSACAPLMVGGAITSAVVASDRRTAGAQLEDQGIELRGSNRLKEQMGSRGRVSVTSFNRRVLLSGEVANERDKALAEEIIKGVDNVASVFNELGVVNSPSFSDQAADSLLTGRVKAAMVDAEDLAANSFKVVTNPGTVYLMGRLTQKEADMATEVARTTKGATRVVRVMEVLTEEELARVPVAK